MQRKTGREVIKMTYVKRDLDSLIFETIRVKSSSDIKPNWFEAARNQRMDFETRVSPSTRACSKKVMIWVKRSCTSSQSSILVKSAA